jgi:hypothetical protein
MARLFLILAAALVLFAGSAEAGRKPLKVYEVRLATQADVQVVEDCGSRRAVDVEFVRYRWQADRLVFVLPDHLRRNADAVVCRQ